MLGSCAGPWGWTETVGRGARYRRATGWIDGRGPTWREAGLEARLLTQDARTRWMLVTVLIFVAVIAGFGLIPLEWADLREAPPLQRFNMTLFPGLFATSAFAIYHGQNLFGYEGEGDEASMVRPVAPAVVAGASFNRKALAVAEKNFARRTSRDPGRPSCFPCAPPYLFLIAFDRVVLQFAPIVAIGALSLLARPLWLRGLAALYEWNRYAMARGFRASRD